MEDAGTLQKRINDALGYLETSVGYGDSRHISQENAKTVREILTGSYDNLETPIDRISMVQYVKGYILGIQDAESMLEVNDVAWVRSELGRALRESEATLKHLGEKVNLVCDSCKQGEHDECKGGTWCDCQHRKPRS